MPQGPASAEEARIRQEKVTVDALPQNPILDIVALIRQGAEIEACIPEDMSSEALIDGLITLGTQLSRVSKYKRVLQYGIGKMMTQAMRKPDFLEKAGFKNFADYQAHLIQFSGMERSTLWRWKPIYEALPNLTREQLKIPARSLYMIVMNVRESVRDEVLALAAAEPKPTYEKLRAKAEDNGYLGSPIEGGANLTLTGSKSEIREVRQFLESEAIQIHVGTSKAIEIVLAALHETSSSGWPPL